MRMWTQARLAREAGVSPTTVSGIETGKIGRPHFGTLEKLARALRVAPEELLDLRESVVQQGPAHMSLGWARDSEEGEFESGLEGASLESLDSLSCELAPVGHPRPPRDWHALDRRILIIRWITQAIISPRS